MHMDLVSLSGPDVLVWRPFSCKGTGLLPRNHVTRQNAMVHMCPLGRPVHDVVPHPDVGAGGGIRSVPTSFEEHVRFFIQFM